MKIYCNYSKQDWKRSFVWGTVLCLIIFAPAFSYFQIVYIPFLNFYNEHYLTWLKETKPGVSFYENVFKNFNFSDNSKENIEQFKTKFQYSLALVELMSLGPVILPLLPMIYWLYRSQDLAFWVTKKCKLNPRMRLYLKLKKQ